MTKHLVDIDDDVLGAARAELGTATLKETVDEALRLAASPRGEHVSRALDALAVTSPPTAGAGGGSPISSSPSAAEVEGLTVLHYDQDLDKIAKLTGQACQWVVPAGSID